MGVCRRRKGIRRDVLQDNTVPCFARECRGNFRNTRSYDPRTELGKRTVRVSVRLVCHGAGSRCLVGDVSVSCFSEMVPVLGPGNHAVIGFHILHQCPKCYKIGNDSRRLYMLWAVI
jgi:hypothetical protein